MRLDARLGDGIYPATALDNSIPFRSNCLRAATPRAVDYSTEKNPRRDTGVV
jgi:hypothetical protein